MSQLLSVIGFLRCSYFTFNGAIKHLNDVFPLDNNSVLQLFAGHELFYLGAFGETCGRTTTFSNGQSSAGVPFLGQQNAVLKPTTKIMVDITAKLFWYRTKEWYENMADKLNDIVYSDDSKETVNVVNLLLLGWILLGLIVYIIGNVIAAQLRKRKATFSSQETEIFDEKHEPAEHVSHESDVKSSAPEILQEPIKLEKPLVIPTCIGDEEEIVEWINSVFSWIYKNRVVSPIIAAWISALNARTRLLSTEVSILIINFVCYDLIFIILFSPA